MFLQWNMGKCVYCCILFCKVKNYKWIEHEWTTVYAYGEIIYGSYNEWNTSNISSIGKSQAVILSEKVSWTMMLM